MIGISWVRLVNYLRNSFYKLIFKRWKSYVWLIIHDVLEDLLKIALTNIGKSSNNISLEVSLSDCFTETDFFKTNPCVINVEDALFYLGSSNEVDGIFYCCVMRVDLAHTSVAIARFFECGAFNGYFSNKSHPSLKEQLQPDELLPYLTYIEKDVEANKQRDEHGYMKKGRNLVSILYSWIIFLYTYFFMFIIFFCGSVCKN